MSRFFLAPAAEQDILSILAWTHQHFGEAARLRYEALLTQAIIDIANDPYCSGSIARPEMARAARTYHLHHSRNRLSTSIGRVKRPRHFFVYRLRESGEVEIGRVLHDSVDLDRHVNFQS